MRLSWFARPRTVWLPTLAGWAALGAAAAVGAAAAARTVPGFLAVHEPVGRGILVVEGWISRAALDRAAEVARAGRYRAVVVTGGPILDAPSDAYQTFAERAGAYLRVIDHGDVEIDVVPTPATTRDRTWASAVGFRRWSEGRGWRLEAVDVFTAGPHARRSRAMYRRALGEGVAVGSQVAAPRDYDLERWWRSSAGAKDVLGEAIGYGWMLCCFSPSDGG